MDEEGTDRGDSPWGLVGSVMKYFRMDYEEIVMKRSYKNILLLNASIPSYKSADKGKGGKDGNKTEPQHANDIFDALM